MPDSDRFHLFNFFRNPFLIWFPEVLTKEEQCYTFTKELYLIHASSSHPLNHKEHNDPGEQGTNPEAAKGGISNLIRFWVKVKSYFKVECGQWC